jgi:phage pi2 protein 07
MLTVKIDETQVQQLCRERIAELVKEVDAEYVFWDTSELKKRTCMSWNFIQENFFFDPRFPKHKIGSKWYFPVRETRKFLEQWLIEQPKC